MTMLIQICFRRPVTVTAFYLFMLLLAGIAYVRLPVALLPDLRYPALVVWTGYPDVPPERVERGVTERIEEAVAGTEGVVRLNSRSLLGGSLVRIDFSWQTNLDLALIQVREQIDRLGEALPQAAERPIVLRLNPADRPILMIALRGRQDAAAQPQDEEPNVLIERKRLARDVIARRLEQLPDIARVLVTGGYERRVEVQIVPDRLAALNISIEQLGQALRSANVALPGGMIRRGPFRYAVEVSGEFQTLDEIAATVVARRGPTPIRLSDVAHIQDGLEERRGLVRFDGLETLLLLVERKPDANTVQAAATVRAELMQLETELPGIRLDVVVDESTFIEQAIGGVAQAVWLGGFLAVIILFLFLRHPRLLLAVAVAVPLSLALTLVLFDGLGVTFNLISLSGLALGVGMLVDNAIVVIENITRLRDTGQAPLEAAQNGVTEVAGAITASTLTTIVVFLPITFVEGLAGRLFQDQSLAVVSSLAASLLVALTAVPLLARTAFTKPPVVDRVEKEQTNVHRRPAGHDTGAAITYYERSLLWALRHKAGVLLASLLVLLLAAWLGWWLPREVVPQTDQGRLIAHLTLPTESDPAFVDMRARAVSEMIRRHTPVEHILADLGERDEARLDLDPRPPYEGDLLLLLAPDQSFSSTQSALQQAVWPEDTDVELKPVRTQLEALLVSDEADLLIDLTADLRLDADQVVDTVLARLTMLTEVSNVRRADAAEIPAFHLELKRETMSRFGAGTDVVTAYIEAAARGRHVTELRTINEDIPIVLRAVEKTSIEQLLSERIATPNGLLPLDLFVRVTPVMLPAALQRVEQTPVVRIEADIAPNSDLASAVTAVEDVLAETLPPQVRATVRGANEAFRNSLQALMWSLLLSVLLVYLILAAQFESLLQPLIILSTVPLAGAGVVCILWLTGHTLNLMSLTGTVVLVGIVVNDAIIKVDFINQRRAMGLSLQAAVLEAGHDRFRPIIMTTLTTVLGLLPLALGFGEGAELRAPLAVAVVGGLSAATMLTLIVVPVLYAAIAKTER